MRTPLNATRSLSILLIFILMLSGCLTIEEHYTFKKNGSGTMEYVVDMSELGELMKAFESLETDKKKDPADDMTMVFGDKTDRLKTINGISGVKVRDKDPYKQKIKFKFKNIDALNEALNVLIQDTTGTTHTYFTFKDGIIERDNDRHLADVKGGLGEEEEGDTASGEEMLRTMNYVFDMKFATGIADLQVAEGTELERKGTKQFKLTSNFWHITQDPKALDMRIDLNSK